MFYIGGGRIPNLVLLIKSKRFSSSGILLMGNSILPPYTDAVMKCMETTLANVLLRISLFLIKHNDMKMC